MRVRRLDTKGDWTFGQSRANYATESEAIAQNVITRLRSFQGDWFLNLDHGLPWFQNLEKPASQTRLKQSIKKSVIETAGVTVVTSTELLFDEDTRKVTVYITYDDIYTQNNQLSSPL